MSEPRDGAASGAHHELEELLGTVAARLRVRDGLHATSAALTCAAAVIVVGRLSGFTPLATWVSVLVAAALCATAVITWNGPRRTTRAAAALVERSNPHLRNLIVTAEELLSRRGRTAAYMRDRVLAEASRESTRGRSARRRAVGRPTRRRPARAPPGRRSVSDPSVRTSRSAVRGERSLNVSHGAWRSFGRCPSARVHEPAVVARPQSVVSRSDRRQPHHHHAVGRSA